MSQAGGVAVAQPANCREENESCTLVTGITKRNLQLPKLLLEVN